MRPLTPLRWPKLLLGTALIVSVLALAMSVWFSFHREAKNIAEVPKKGASGIDSRKKHSRASIREF